MQEANIDVYQPALTLITGKIPPVGSVNSVIPHAMNVPRAELHIANLVSEYTIGSKIQRLAHLLARLENTKKIFQPKFVPHARFVKLVIMNWIVHLAIVGNTWIPQTKGVLISTIVRLVRTQTELPMYVNPVMRFVHQAV